MAGMRCKNDLYRKPVVPKVVKLEEPTAKERRILDMMLNTGSDIYQGACKRGSTCKDEYRKVCGVAYMDPKDMAKIGVANWDSVKVTTDWGEVIVSSVHSRDALTKEPYSFQKAPGPT